MSGPVLLRLSVVAALLGTAQVSTACYHTIITTNLTPGTEVFHEGFRPAFIAGLVPAQVDGAKACQGRRWARIETQYSFLNWVVGAVTFGIFTPMDVKITCAAGSAQATPPDGPTLRVGMSATDQDRNETFALAATLARVSGEAVIVAF